MLPLELLVEAVGRARPSCREGQRGVDAAGPFGAAQTCVWVCGPERCPAAAHTRAAAGYPGRSEAAWRDLPIYRMAHAYRTNTNAHITDQRPF